MRPFLSLRSLSSHINHAKVQRLHVKLNLMDSSRASTTTKHIFSIRNKIYKSNKSKINSFASCMYFELKTLSQVIYPAVRNGPSWPSHNLPTRAAATQTVCRSFLEENQNSKQPVNKTNVSKTKQNKTKQNKTPVKTVHKQQNDIKHTGNNPP